MLEQLGVPDSFEGLVGIQVFKTRRWHPEPAIFQVAGPRLDGACLRVGQLEDAYLQARALDAASRKHILLWTVGAAKSLDEHLAEEMEEARADQTLQSRAFATLVGWRTEPLPHVTEAHDPMWAADELARGVRSAQNSTWRSDAGSGPDGWARGRHHGQVAQHSFWIAPGRDPTIVLGEFSASVDLSAPLACRFLARRLRTGSRQFRHLRPGSTRLWRSRLSSSPPRRRPKGVG